VNRLRTPLLLAMFGCLLVIAAGCGGDDSEPDASAETTQSTGPERAPVTADLSAVQTFLGDHTDQLVGFTEEFNEQATHYAHLAAAENGDLEALWQKQAAEVGPLLEEMKAGWVEGNPYYERVEGIVAGTPSLAEYDVIIDAGSSAAEDPESAVPFDLTLTDGTVIKQPGNLFNLTEGALWGTLPDALGRNGTPVDLDGDGTTEFGEILPDPDLLLAASETFEQYAKELDESGEAWEPAPSDAFTALVVMVPTMSEYFGQWKVSRFVAGDAASGESFNVVSRLSDIRDILTGLEVIYDGVEPAIAEANKERAAQTGQELRDLRSFVAGLYQREQAGKRYTPEQADTLGTEAQERATAIAGQVSQAAAQLGVEIQQ
jgi:Imelysin